MASAPRTLPPAPGRRGRAARWLVLIALVAVVLTVSWSRPQTLEEVRTIVARAGPWAPALVVLLQATRPVTWFPGNLLSPLAGLLFGFWPGLAWSWLGSSAGMGLGFRVGSLLGEPSAAVSGRLDALRERAGGREWLAVLLARLLPGLPVNLVSYACGSARITFWPYLAASSVGLLPRLAVQVGLGAGLHAVGGAWA